jgi:hypothetical protein
MNWKSLTVLGKLVTVAVAVALLVGAFFLVRSFFTAGLETKVRLGENTADANLDAVEVANEVADDLNKSAGEIDAETKELVDEVLSAPPGNSNAAAVRAVCGMRAYRDSPECAGVRAGGAAVPARSDSPG